MSENQEPKFAIAIESMLPQITEQVAAELKKRALDVLSYEVGAAVRTEVERYIKENIVPSVRAELAAHETEIRASFVEGIRQACLLASTKIVASATKKMADYEGDKVISDVVRALFGQRY